MNAEANMRSELYTIGYSGFTLNEFIDVLSRHGITAIADVRSVPYSKFKPEYNTDHLRIELKNNQTKSEVPGGHFQFKITGHFSGFQ